MDTRLTTHGLGTHGLRATIVWRPAAALLVAVALLAMLAVPASAASPSECQVQNTMTGKTYAALQAAVDAASKGAHLTVQGTCIGKTVIDTKLVIEGVRTATTGKPTLSGAGKSRVVTITKGVRVRMRSFEIVRGSSPKGSGGGGILNQGTLTLVDVVVRGNRAPECCLSGSTHGGGGIYNAGTLTLTGSSRVQDNLAPAGGGVYNQGSLTMNDAVTISGNGMTYDVDTLGSGGGVMNDGTLTMNDSSSIHHNSAGGGGGVSNWAGTLTMNDSSAIHDNTGDGGGGVNNYLGTVSMNDSSTIHSNRAGTGGGVDNSGTMTMAGSSSIHGNSVHDYYESASCAGVYNDYGDGTFTMTGSSSIHDNSAEGDGGGVCNDGTFTMTGSSSIHDNSAGVRGFGGVVSQGSVIGVICAPTAGANVFGNTPKDCWIGR